MSILKILITGLLCLLLFVGTAYAQDLEKKISLKVEAATLAHILEQIQEEHQLHFSYVNNELSTDTIRNFQVAEEPLFRVLDMLLEKAGTGYMTHGGQVIINKAFRKAPPEEKQPKDKESVKESSLAPQWPVEQSDSSATQQEKASPAKHILPEELTEEQEVQQVQKEGEMMPERKEAVHHSLLAVSKQEAARPAPETDFRAPEGKKKARQQARGASGKKSTSARKQEQDKRRTDAPLKPLHFGLFYPISNHGTNAPQYVNRLSIHGMLGVSAGLEGLEFAGLGNITTGYMEGYQFAGLFNVVKNQVEGAQFAGLANINGGPVSGGQFAGLANFAGENVEGIQAAGLLNLADSIQGTQLAGLFNKADRVEGMQLSGLINVAGKLKGTQVGVFNFSDSIEGGIPIGLFSFVKNGYNALEVYAGEDFHANLNFKVGVQKFYNILAVGLEVNDQQRWGLGYGVGSEWKLGKYYHLNTDLLAYYIFEHSIQELDGTWQQNSLYKTRLLVSRSIGRKMALFAGPTYNISVTELPTEEAGLMANPFYERIASNNTIVRMWIGFNAGIRF